MQHANKPQIHNGDWVRGKSVNDEIFHGFVEAVRPKTASLKVRVTECDNTESIGRTVEARMSAVEVLPMNELNEEGYIRNLIDFALVTRDKALFLELTDQLRNCSNHPAQSNKSSTGQPISRL